MHKYIIMPFSISNIYQHLVEQSKIERVEQIESSFSALTTWSRVPTQSQEWRSCGRSRSKVYRIIMLAALRNIRETLLSFQTRWIERRDVREKFVDTMKGVIKGNFPNWITIDQKWQDFESFFALDLNLYRYKENL